MKKGQLLSILLWGSMGCAVNISSAVASSSMPANKKVESSHNKTAKKTSSTTRTRRMTERDISDCTVLLDKVAQTDKAIQKDMLSMSTTNNSKISEHLKKSADTQIFASDDPAAIAHLTGKSAKLPAQQSSKALVPLATTMPVPTSRFAPPPVFKPTTATLVASASKTSKYVAPPAKHLATLPPNTQVFASNDPKAIAHLTGKITPPLSETMPRQPERLMAKPIANKPLAAKSVAPDKPITKPLAAKPLPNKTPMPHPRIELFAPNSPDLNHLEGKSANLADFQKLEADKKSAHKKQSASTAKKKHS